MNNTLIVEAMLVVLCLAEIPHDKAQINDSIFNPVEQKRWHFWSGVYYVLVTIFLGYFAKAPLFGGVLLLQSFAIRLVVFGCGLNVARKGWSEFFYLSDKGIDGLIKKTIGGRLLIILCIVALVLSNLYF